MERILDETKTVVKNFAMKFFGKHTFLCLECGDSLVLVIVAREEKSHRKKVLVFPTCLLENSFVLCLSIEMELLLFLGLLLSPLIAVLLEKHFVEVVSKDQLVAPSK